VLIGLFVVFASTAEQAQTETDVLLARTRVSDVMTPHPITAPAGLTVQELLDQLLLEHRVSAFPVVDERGHPVGLVTLDRIRRIPAAQRPFTRLADAACPLDEVVVTASADPVAELIPRLLDSVDRRALVVELGELVGIVSHTDIVRALEVARLSADGRAPRERGHAPRDQRDGTAVEPV
jgi:CBS domain-containing protein